MKKASLYVAFLLVCTPITLLHANSLKEAFSEGLKASVKVMSHEKSQASLPIEDGYCLALEAKHSYIDAWEEIKFESLALVLGYKPALFEEDTRRSTPKRILCLTVAQDKEKALEALTNIAKAYPKIGRYHTPIKKLSKDDALHRVIPAIGQYMQAEMPYNVAPEKPQSVILKTVENEENEVYSTSTVSVITSDIEGLLFIQHPRGSKL